MDFIRSEEVKCQIFESNPIAFFQECMMSVPIEKFI